MVSATPPGTVVLFSASTAPGQQACTLHPNMPMPTHAARPPPGFVFKVFRPGRGRGLGAAEPSSLARGLCRVEFSGEHQTHNEPQNKEQCLNGLQPSRPCPAKSGHSREKCTWSSSISRATDRQWQVGRGGYLVEHVLQGCVLRTSAHSSLLPFDSGSKFLSHQTHLNSCARTAPIFNLIPPATLQAPPRSL